MTPAQVLSEANTLERVLPTTRYYPLRHMAPYPVKGGTSWQNDGQNFVFDPYSGLWRTWALGNPDWKPADGFPQTSWIEYAGPALDQMVPLGVRLDRADYSADIYTSGSVFVDWHNKLGRGHGAAWYFVATLSAEHLQALMLLTAPALGTTPHVQGIVIPNDAVPPDQRGPGLDLRDCRVFWDDAHDQLVLSATCGAKFIFFASTDGFNWRYLSTLAGPGPLVECPNMLQVPLHDANGSPTGKTRWVILGAVQGAWSGATDSFECCAVWVGNWDGTTFTPDAGYPLPVDYGPDSYASTTGTDHLGRPFMGYWLGNWEYCTRVMPFEGFQNIQGLPRQCWLQPDSSGVVRLFSAPLETDLDAYSTSYAGSRQTLDSTTAYAWPNQAIPTGKCARVDITLERISESWPETITLQLRAGTVNGQSFHTDLTVNGTTGTVILDRSKAGSEGPAAPVPASWTRPYTMPASLGVTSGKTITLSVLLDSCSVEAFINGGLGSMAALIFPPDTCQGLSLTASGTVSATATIHHY